MSKAVWQSAITDEAGNIIPGASVEFRDADTDALVSTWTDRAGLTLGGNPVVDDDSDGFVRAYLTQGRYKITATSPGRQRIWRDVVLLENAALDPTARTEATATLAAGDNDNVDPAGWVSSLGGTGFLILEAAAGAANLTGLPEGVPDQELTVYAPLDNAYNVTLVPEDTGSDAERRLTGLELTLTPGMTCQLKRVASLARWVIV